MVCSPFRLILCTYEADVVKGGCGLGEAAQHATQVGQLILVEGQVAQASRQLTALQVTVAVSIVIQLKVHEHEIFFLTFFAETETLWS
jgi:hypothetical protein